MPFARSFGSSARDPATYDAVLEQFGFDSAPRYQPTNGATYCATAAEDAAAACGVVLPKVYGANCHVGKPINGDGSPFCYLQANDLQDWLASIDGSGVGGHGWVEAESLADAQAKASLGYPTLATYKNPAGHGHIAFIMSDGTLAQAGAKCGYHIPFGEVFGALPARFWYHL